MAGKRTIYVSSTFEDLQEHRAALKVELERAGFDVESMERYAAFAEPPLERCLADVAACDGYVLVLAHRYGYRPQVDGEVGPSITQLEYEQARRRGKPVFVFCIDEDHGWKPRYIDQGNAAQALAALRTTVEAAHGRRLFTDPDNLVKQVLAALSSHRWVAEQVDESPPAVAASYRWPEPWDFGAYMAERRGVFEGRAWLFQRVDSWLAAAGPHALLMHANFGVGKSAFMAELVQRGGAVLAWHFCQHDTNETLQPGAFVRSLSGQLARTLPAYRQMVEVDPALQELLDRAMADPGSALEGAVLGPLARLPAPDAPRLLLLDALDEALELNTTDTKRGSLVQLLAAKAARFPTWLRVLATARPNPSVLRALQGPFDVQALDAESANNVDDLRRYIGGRFAHESLASALRRSAHTPQQLADRLLRLSEGKFLYAVRALRDLEQGSISVAELTVLPPGMDSFYLDAFERRFPRAGRDYAAARELLGLVCAAREPLPRDVLAEVLRVSESELRAVHAALPDFLRLRAGRLAFDHLSLAEWLTCEDAHGFARAGEFAVDLAAAQARLRAWALARVQAGTAQASPYLLRHLAAHLADAGERRSVYAALMLERFDWLHARLELSGVDALLDDAEHLAGHDEQSLLRAVLRNSAPTLRQAPQQLAPQVLGRAQGGLGRGAALRRLAADAGEWLGRQGRQAARDFLVPGSRSLRVSTAYVATFAEGGECLAALPDGRIASGCFHGSVRLWDPARASEPVLFRGHSRWVRALAVLPDGRIASGSSDHTVRLWDPARAAEPVVFVGHTDEVLALAVLPDGRIASGARDATVRLWDPACTVEPVVFEGHAGGVWALAVLHDGRVASGSSDHTVRLWSPAREAEPVVFVGHSDAVNALAALPDGRIASGSNDSTVRLWDPERVTEPVVLRGHSDHVRALAVLPDGRIASGSKDSTVRLWDPARVTEPVVFEGHSEAVNAVAVLSDGRIASGSSDSTVRLWDPTRAAEPVIFKGHRTLVRALALMPDGCIASGCIESVCLWEPGRTAEPAAYVGHSDRISGLAVMPDGCIASVSWDGNLCLWNPARAAEPVVFNLQLGAVTALAAGPDGSIAFGAWDYNVRLWDPMRAAWPVVLEGHVNEVRALAVLPDGRIASGSSDGTVRLWDPARAAELMVYQGHSTWVNALVALHDGRIASGSLDGTVRLWGQGCQAGQAVIGHGLDDVRALAALPDGRIVSGSFDRKVRLWDPASEDWRVVFDAHSAPVNALAVLRDGRIASGSADHTVRLWDPSGRRPTRLFIADAEITALATTPDDLIAAGCADGAVHFLREA